MSVVLKGLFDNDAAGNGRPAEGVERDAGDEGGDGPGEEDEWERHHNASLLQAEQGICESGYIRRERGEDVCIP